MDKSYVLKTKSFRKYTQQLFKQYIFRLKINILKLNTFIFFLFDEVNNLPIFQSQKGHLFGNASYHHVFSFSHNEKGVSASVFNLFWINKVFVD